MRHTTILAFTSVLALFPACSSDDEGKPTGADAGSGGSNATGGAGGSKSETGGKGGEADSGAEISPDLIVTLDDGKVQGDHVGGARQFLKIPFARPPLGDLRWKAPVPNDPWSGVRHETEFVKGCPQNASSQGPASTNEDCLYLNVWSPAGTPKDAPVMVWIHGGGNFAGTAGDYVPGSDPPILWYDGQFFAKNQNVVVVSVEYRLGPMGFFAHPALAKEDSPLGNQGLYDQRLALQWVKKNIEKFGGNPGNVTIFGESAGSSDVCFHVVSPLSKGLFHRAISESGGCTISIDIGRDKTAAGAAPGMLAFTKALGCDTAGDPLACLRQKPIDDIMANAAQPTPTSGDVAKAAWSFGVVIDGEGGFVPDQARTLFEKGAVSKVPYLLGSNNDEGALFILTAAITSQAEYDAQLKSRFGDYADQVAALYPPSRFDGDFRAAVARAIGDSSLGCGTDDTARRAAKAGLPVYVYNFNIPWAVAPDLLHVSHAAEMSHVFGNPYKADDAGKAVSVAMNTFWAAFAKSGDPNFEGAPATWPRFAPTSDGADAGTDGDQRLQLDPGWEVLDGFRKDDCAFWRTIYDQAK